MMLPSLRVGELAEQAAVSVRTLHHYDEIGLLCPTQHTAAGHRRYSTSDLLRLQQITSLRQLGFSLREIRAWLDDPSKSARDIVDLHLARLRERIEVEQELCDELQRLRSLLDSNGGPAAEDLTRVIAETQRVGSYFTREQRATIRARSRALGHERIARSQEAWMQLLAEVRDAMRRGDDPSSEAVSRLADRWARLVHDFTGGDAQLAAGVRRAYESEETIHGLDTAEIRAMCAFLGRPLLVAR
jgi:MerR family transcriptional regulator, thiopeptide resistance regulator